MKFQYLNTDLDLVAERDLQPLATALEVLAVSALHVTAGEDGRWYATFEINHDLQVHNPESTIIAMLDAVDALNKSDRRLWAACLVREFNVGFDCGDKPWAFNEGMTNATLRRIAKVGASLRITLYPPTKKGRRVGDSR
jgi:hypothetical protein